MISAVPAIASAQDATTSYGVKVGFNISNITIDFQDANAEVTNDGRAGLVIGGWVARDFTPRFGIQVEGLYSQKGAEFDPDVLGTDDASLKLGYIEFPVLARVNFPGSKASFHILAGPTFGFKVNDSLKVAGVEFDADEELGDLSSFDMGFALGAAVDIRQFVIDARYTWGLTNINSDDDADEVSAKNHAFSMTFGWRFR